MRIKKRYVTLAVIFTAIIVLASLTTFNFVILISQKSWRFTAGNAVSSVAISANGEYIISGGDGGYGYRGSNDNTLFLFKTSNSIHLWDYDTGKEVTAVAISGDGTFIIVGCIGGDIFLFNKSSSTPVWEYSTGENINSVSISFDGNFATAGGNTNRIYLFNTSSSTPLWSYLASGNVDTVKISDDGNYIVAGSESGRVYLLQRSSSTPLWSYLTGNDINSVDISANGSHIIAGSGDHYIYLFNYSSSTPLWSYNTYGWMRSVAISANGEYIISGGIYSVFFFHYMSSNPVWTFSSNGWINSVDISANGDYVVAGNDMSMFYVFSKASSTPLWEKGFEFGVQTVAISASGKTLAAGTYSEQLDDLFHYFEGNLFVFDLYDHTLDYEIMSNLIILSFLLALCGITLIITLIRSYKRILLERFSILKNQVKNNLDSIDRAISQKKYDEVIDYILKSRELIQQYKVPEIKQIIDRKILQIKNVLTNFYQAKVRKTILDLGTKYSRLMIAEIMEKTGIQDELLTINVISNMIRNSEIFAEYFDSTKAIAFNLRANVDEIDRLMDLYREWGDLNIGKKIN